MKYAPSKTLGPRSAHLFTELHERNRQTFTLKDVCEITGLTGNAARSLIYKARKRGLVTQLKPGMYNLVPFELGYGDRYVADPYLIARDAVGDTPYFLSHATAFELHRMTTQPTLEIFVSSTRRLRPQVIGDYRYRFVFVPKDRFFGTTTLWIRGNQQVTVSDRERTLIDGLRQPQYVGGITEAAKGLWMVREKIDFDRLVLHAVRLGVGAVMCRLGYLLELYGLVKAQVLEPLREHLTRTHHLLDPTLPREGPRLSRWRLQLNVAPEEIDAVR